MLLPWTVEGPFPGQRETKKRHGFAAYANIVNRLGIYVAQGLPPEVAAGIVEAVNGMDAMLKLQRMLLGWSIERDRLRDIVRRIAEFVHHSCYACDGPWEIDIKCSCKSDNYHGNADALLREAREALGESMKDGAR